MILRIKNCGHHHSVTFYFYFEFQNLVHNFEKSISTGARPFTRHQESSSRTDLRRGPTKQKKKQGLSMGNRADNRLFSLYNI